jgi:hypothetical protein
MSSLPTPSPSRLPAVLLRIGASLFLAAALLWLAGGARSGLYQTTLATTHVDPVLGFEYQEFRDGFAPGVETLGLGFLAFFLSYLAASAIERRGGRRPQPDNPIATDNT